MNKTIPEQSDDEEQYIDRVLETAEMLVKQRGMSASDVYVTIEANTALYLIKRYRNLNDTKNKLN